MNARATARTVQIRFLYIEVFKAFTTDEPSSERSIATSDTFLDPLIFRCMNTCCGMFRVEIGQVTAEEHES